MTPVENMIGRSSIEGDRKRKARNARRKAPDQRGEPGEGQGVDKAGQSGGQPDGQPDMERQGQSVQQEQDRPGSGQMSAQMSAQASAQASGQMSMLPDKCPDIRPQGNRTATVPPPDVAAIPGCPPMMQGVQYAMPGVTSAMPGCPPMWGDRFMLGRFRNVLLTRKELSDLRAAFPGLTDNYIERLSKHMQSTRRTCENHADTLRKWILKDAAKAVRPAGLPGYDHNYAVEEGESI